MPRKSILVILPIAAWPARANGVSIRYDPVLLHLARHHDLDLLITADPDAAALGDELPRASRNVRVLAQDGVRPTLMQRLGMILRVISPFGVSFEYATYTRDRLADVLRSVVAGTHYDTIHCVGCLNREALEDALASASESRITYDCVDSPFLHYKRSTYPNFLARAFAPFRAFDLWKTKRWERSLLRRVDASVYISDVDANAAGTNDVSTVIPNGIYGAMTPYVHDERDTKAPCIGFLGNMSYQPNVIGVQSLHANVYLPLKATHPDLRLKIIGRDPAPEIMALAGPDVEVTGTVDEIWPHLRDVDVFVFPMSTGAGLQNKIIEVMHAGRPVVTTPICQMSVGAEPGSEILVAESAAEMLAGTRSLIDDPARARALANAGRRFVDRRFDVDEIVARFVGLLLPDQERAEAARVAASTSR